MKKGRPIFQLLSFMLIVVCSSHPANGQIEGKWTGTISFHEKFEGITGKSEKKINVSVTDNRCRGTITYEDDGGGAVKGKTSCHGQGEVEFVTLIINRNDSIYTIETEGPTCSEGSNPWTRGQGNDILIADKPLGINPNILSGVDTKVSQLPANMGTVTTTISWQLSQAAPAFELIITPVNYDNWLPEPGMDELKKGTVMEIGLKVQGRNGAPLTLKAEKFEIRLSNTSREPGITLNAPLYPNVQQLPDLRLLPLAIAESKAEDQFITINCTDGSTGKVFIGSYDGGGWTTLTVVAVMKDRSTIRGNLLVAGGETEIPIPKRTSESVIATAWLNDHGNPKDIDDIERSNGNANNGDGLTAYEEYRGFISMGKFLRLNPQEKELGIKIKKEELPDFSEAFSWFKRGSDLDIVLFAGDEINEFRQLNKNFKYAHSFDQKALLLIKGNLPRDVFGRVYTISDFPDIPLRTMKVVFDVTHIHAFYSVLMSRGYLPSTCTEAEFTAKTITHELSHAVNIWHHGELDNEPSPQTFYQNSTPDTHIFDRIGNEIFTRPYTLYGAIGRRGNQESGDLSCVMTYLPVYIWAFRFGSDGSYNFYQVPLIPLGRKLCSSKVGTDFNTPPTNYNARNNYFGNAAVGNCLSQIKLKD